MIGRTINEIREIKTEPWLKWLWYTAASRKSTNHTPVNHLFTVYRVFVATWSKFWGNTQQLNWRGDSWMHVRNWVGWKNKHFETTRHDRTVNPCKSLLMGKYDHHLILKQQHQFPAPRTRLFSAAAVSKSSARWQKNAAVCTLQMLSCQQQHWFNQKGQAGWRQTWLLTKVYPFFGSNHWQNIVELGWCIHFPRKCWLLPIWNHFFQSVFSSLWAPPYGTNSPGKPGI